MAMASVIAYTFLTDYFPKYSKEFLTHQEAYQPIIDKRDLAIKKAIKGTEVEKIINEITIESKKELAEYDKIYYKLKYEHYFLGYTSFRNFVLGTGMSLLSFSISILFLFVIVKHIKDKFLRKYYLSLSFVLTVTTGFWLSWSFLHFSIDKNRPFDFPRSLYDFCIYILPILVFFSTYFLFKYLASEIKLKEAIQILIKFIVLDVKNEFVTKPKEKSYIKSYFNILRKVNEKV